MPSTADQDAWVTTVLDFDLSAYGSGTDGAMHGPPGGDGLNGAGGHGAAAPTDQAPAEPERGMIGAVMDKVASVVGKADRAARLKALEEKNPAAAKSAAEAFDKFDRVLGDTPVTPEGTRKASQDRAAKEQSLTNALKALKAAQAMPEGADKAKAVKDAQTAYQDAKGVADKAVELENAMLGRVSLANAITHGPLSPESGAPFKPETAAKLIAAYGKNPRMADAAVTIAGSAKFPDTVADNVGPMIDKTASGFAAKDGQAFDDRDMAQKYGQDLLSVGATVGPDYFGRLNDYVSSGQQFSDHPTGDGTPSSWNELAQNRSVKLAGSLIKSDGSIDVSSDAAKAAIGNVLFHPDAMRNQQVEMSAHVLKTVQFLSDPTTGPQANAVMKGVGAPSNPAAKTLVNRATGHTGNPGADSARTAVMASMMKPLAQGPVGSCFATAPARRMRETQPLDAMKAYADIASKGTYKPPFGPEVPAVTSLPAGDDPIMRSWEYSTATATARRAGSTERKDLARNVALGTAQLEGIATKGVAHKDKDKTWKTKQQKLLKAVSDGFTFTYDPMSVITSASDGKSSQGRYVIERGGKPITTKADFQAAMLSVALSSFGIAAGSDDAKELKKTIDSDAFTTAVTPDGYAPWALVSGGQTTAATQTLFGATLAQKPMTAAVGDPKPSEGDRTKDVVENFLNTFRGNSQAMATIRTVGKHGFNALPNDPSLEPLKGKDAKETDEKVKANLIDKGKQIKDTALSAERAAYLFDTVVGAELANQADPALKKLIQDGIDAHRPSTAAKPAEVAKAVEAALEGYYDKVADNDAQTWKSQQVTAGNTVAPAALTKHKADRKGALVKSAEVSAKNGMMKDMGVPQFVIADSNWGGSTDHVFFVVAPDPTTGAPTLWEKTVPPGDLQPAGRDWVDAEWASIQ